MLRSSKKENLSRKLINFNGNLAFCLSLNACNIRNNISIFEMSIPIRVSKAPNFGDLLAQSKVLMFVTFMEGGPLAL